MTMRSRWLSYETGVLLLLGLTFGFLFFDRNAAGYLIPFIAPELKLNNAQIGWVSAGLSLTWAVSAYVFGALSDRMGVRKPFLLASVLVFSACSFLSGLSHSFGVLLASRLLMGLAEGLFLPVAMTILMVVSSEQRRGFNMGVMQNFFSNLLGSFAAPLVSGRNCAALQLAHVVLHRGSPWSHLCAADCQVRARAPRVAAVTTAGRAHESTAGLFDLLRVRNVWLCVLISVFMVPWMVLAWAFMPVFYTNYRHFSPSEMSILMSVLGVCAAVGAFVVRRFRIGSGAGRSSLAFAFSGPWSRSRRSITRVRCLCWRDSCSWLACLGRIPAFYGHDSRGKYVAVARGDCHGPGGVRR